MILRCERKADKNDSFDPKHPLLDTFVGVLKCYGELFYRVSFACRKQIQTSVNIHNNFIVSFHIKLQ